MATKKYLSLIAQAKEINKQYELTHLEISLLHISAIRDQANDPATVGELIQLRDMASQTTLHNALKSLINKKLLTTKRHLGDGRVKQIVLTKLALNHYKKLDEAINHAY
jgi:DNA-binding MarR family transcriptional regulator